MGSWDFDRRRFSDPKGMMDALHAMGFKVLLWTCPFVSMDSPAYRRIAFGTNPDNVNGYPAKGGFLVSSLEPGWGGVPPPAAVEWWNGKSALLDFTHPNAVAWFTEQLDRLVRDYGADGFKFDGGGIHFYAGCAGLEGALQKTFAHDAAASPWRVLGEAHQRIFREIVALRQRFAPRITALAKESARTGEPMMRTLEYVFPDRCYAEIKDEFLMGEALLVAPVLEKGATSRSVVLPPGRWKADDGQTYEGPAEIEVTTPLSRLPYFERRG